MYIDTGSGYLVARLIGGELCVMCKNIGKNIKRALLEELRKNIDTNVIKTNLKRAAIMFGRRKERTKL